MVAVALASTVQATPTPGGGPSTIKPPPGSLVRPTPAPTKLEASEDTEANGGGFSSNLPVITIHSTDNVVRGKTGTFVLHMKPALMLGGTYVNFSVGGTAVAGVDYKLLVSPAYISQSGYGVIQIETLADPRGSAFRQAYSVVIRLQPGAGYAVGQARSAIMWIK